MAFEVKEKPIHICVLLCIYNKRILVPRDQKLNISNAPDHPLKKQERMGKKLKDLNSFKSAIVQKKWGVYVLATKPQKQKIKKRNNGTFSTKLRAVDSFVKIATILTSATLSATGVGLKKRPLATATSCIYAWKNQILSHLVNVFTECVSSKQKKFTKIVLKFIKICSWNK